MTHDCNVVLPIQYNIKKKKNERKPKLLLWISNKYISRRKGYAYTQSEHSSISTGIYILFRGWK